MRPTISCFPILRIETDFFHRFHWQGPLPKMGKKRWHETNNFESCESEITPKKLAWDHYFSWVSDRERSILSEESRAHILNHSEKSQKTISLHERALSTVSLAALNAIWKMIFSMFFNSISQSPRSRASSQSLENSPFFALINFCLLVHLQQYLLAQCANVQQRFSTVLLLQNMAIQKLECFWPVT